MFTSKVFNIFFTKRFYDLPPESYRKARLLIHSILLSLLFSLLYIGISFITGFVAARYAMYTSALVMALLLLFCNGKNWRVMASFFVGIVWMLTTTLIYFSGDVMSSMLSWLVITPLTALMVLSKREQWIWLAITLISVVFFLIFPQSQSDWVYASAWPEFYNATLVIGLICMVFLINNTFQIQQNRLLLLSESQNEELRAAEEELRQSMEELSATQDALNEQNTLISSRQHKTEMFLNTLIELAMCEGILQGDRDLAYKDILSTTAKALNTSRVSIWRYQEEEQCIECMALYDNGSVSFRNGVKLYQKEYSPYFKAVLEEKIIVANDARSHPATSTFTESYLIPTDIYSMLDTPYTENGKFQGVICCEHQGKMRKWDQEEVLFVNSMADLVCMAIHSSERKQFEREILVQREQILEQNKKLVSYADEIKLINQSLEDRVAERTAALHEQNKQLTEYAFVNAHLLRGPLSRILGLAEVIRQTQSREELIKFVELLDVSTKELDAIVHRITDILNEGRKLDRDAMRQ